MSVVVVYICMYRDRTSEKIPPLPKKVLVWPSNFIATNLPCLHHRVRQAATTCVVVAMQRSSSAGTLPSNTTAAVVPPAANEKRLDGAQLFAQLLTLDDGAMKSDYHGPGGWDTDALLADLNTLGGSSSDLNSRASSAAVASFQRADEFSGARHGHVFKNGPLGLGYYSDTPPVPAPLHELLAAEEGSTIDITESPTRKSGFARPAGSSTAGLAKAIRDDLRGVH